MTAETLLEKWRRQAGEERKFALRSRNARNATGAMQHEARAETLSLCADELAALYPELALPGGAGESSASALSEEYSLDFDEPRASTEQLEMAELEEC